MEDMTQRTPRSPSVAVRPRLGGYLRLRIASDLREALDQIAKQEERTTSDIARRFLQHAVARWGKRHAPPKTT